MSPMNTGDDESTAVALARMETKLDLVIGQHTAKLEDHEQRLRQAASASDLSALETDVRALSERKTVSPMGLLGAASGVVGLLGGLIVILQNLNL